MSIITSTCQQISASPTNTSKSKMLYSFPRTRRFRVGKQNQCDRFYDIGNGKVQNMKAVKRATGLGYGSKYDFTKDLPNTPSPGAYEITSQFGVGARKGFGFGSGRGEMEVTGLVKKNLNPGPGAYEIVDNKTSKYSSLKGKGKIDERQQRYQPGPGTYQSITSFNKTGKNFFSRYKNKSACKFANEQKLKFQNRKVPGPGFYDTSKTQFSPLQSAKSSKFGTSSRMNMSINSQSRCQTPGPGNYRLPSEFGYYISKNALKQQKQKTSYEQRQEIKQ